MISLYQINYHLEYRFPEYRRAEEEKTKLAFTVITHDQLGLFEVLLHTIFRPYNAYCIYIGSNTGDVYKQNVEQLVNCYKYLYPESTVFMAQNVDEVRWGNWSLIEADLICMNQLLDLTSQ